MKCRTPYRRAPWFDLPEHRIRLLHDLTTVASDVHVVRSRFPGGFTVQCVLEPAGLAPQRVVIAFHPDAQHDPAVWAPGSPTSPHRYDDDSLCMWYPKDPPEQRWMWQHGAKALAGHICAHLIRENWWNLTDEWVGAEAPHD